MRACGSDMAELLVAVAWCRVLLRSHLTIGTVHGRSVYFVETKLRAPHAKISTARGKNVRKSQKSARHIADVTRPARRNN